MKKNILSALLLLFFFGCAQKANKMEAIDKESQALNHWLDEKFEEHLLESPEFLSRLGRKERNGEWDDLSESFALKKLEKAKGELSEMAQFDKKLLDEQALISYEIYHKRLSDQLKYEKYRHFRYPVNQMFGAQSGIPSFLINIHKVENEEDAKMYILRLQGVSTKLGQVIEQLRLAKSHHVIPPRFVFEHVLRDCENVIGDPDRLQENLLYKDFESKIRKTKLEAPLQDSLLGQVISALEDHVIPAYNKLSLYLQKLEGVATDDDGVWKFSDGEGYYQYCLEKITTTQLTAQEVFTTGENEVKRIHDEIRTIMKKVGFEGDLSEFFAFMRTSPQFYYPSSQEGRDSLLQGYQKIVEDMEARLDEMFLTKPKARMKVKAVESYREKSAGKAFYQRAAPDGSRPGYFYANLYTMGDMPKYEMEALAYHEGIPGHHMQISIAQEIEGLPEFRKHNSVTAYVEGWGLYSELLPKEFGFYQDPYSDFGRLAMELWRACRLVVDVGIHQKKWKREEAIQYLLENTPNPVSSCTKAIERYIVMPGQATGYKIGMIKILEMRKKAKSELGDHFDLRKFHDIVLLSGPVPLDILEKRVDSWILEEKSN